MPIQLLGDANIALLLSAGVALVMVKRACGWWLRDLGTFSEEALAVAASSLRLPVMLMACAVSAAEDRAGVEHRVDDHHGVDHPVARARTGIGVGLARRLQLMQA